MRSVNLRTIALWIVLLAAIPLAGLRWSIRPLPARADQATTISLPLPGGEAGIGLDDLGFAPSIGKVLVPAGRTGLLDLIDPDTKSIASIGGFSSSDAFAHGHGEGITSADYGRGLLFVTDRTVKRLSVVDPNRRSIVASAPLATEPDYVRFVSDTSEVWVTEPSAQRIEIFRLPRAETPQPVHAAFIAVPGGPESLVIDHLHARALTHLWTGTTIVIRLKEHSIEHRWSNGCRGSRGLAIDQQRGFLFAGCAEGKLEVLDLSAGKPLGSAASGAGVDIIAYNEKLGHVYLPGADSATMAIIGVSAKGVVRVLTTVATARHAHCVIADDRAQIYVCDPSKGRILLFKDSLPPS